jgi:DnaJ-domain-containing protein 1
MASAVPTCDQQHRECVDYLFHLLQHVKSHEGRKPEALEELAASRVAIDKYLKILEIDGTPTIATVKKQYRRLAGQYHPDKVGHLGKDLQRLASIKFREIKEAYEVLLQHCSG